MALSRLRDHLMKAGKLIDDGDHKTALQYVQDLVLLEQKNTKIPSAYNLFVKHTLSEIDDTETCHLKKMNNISLLWKSLPQEIRQKYQNQKQGKIEERHNNFQLIYDEIFHKSLYKDYTKGRRKYNKKKGIQLREQHCEEQSQTEIDTEIETDIETDIRRNLQLLTKNKQIVENVQNTKKTDKPILGTNEVEQPESINHKNVRYDIDDNYISPGPGSPVVIPKWNIYEDNDDYDDESHKSFDGL
jgi:hypothetical protein